MSYDGEDMTQETSAKMVRICGLAPVMPVLTIEDASVAAPLARVLVESGLSSLEVTLRTPASLQAIAEIRSAVPEAVVGAGTVRTPEDIERARDAGARFIVSPGLTGPLIVAAEKSRLPYLPGVATASEAMAAAERGFLALKLFPADVVGGVALLKALAGPLPDLLFCPTGGVGPHNLSEYLSLPTVVCVGGSWVAPRSLITSERWTEIGALASEAAGARRG